jgi:hypothetical protein
MRGDASMTEKKPPQTADDVLRDLHEFLLGAEPDFQSMPIEKVQEYLKEAGVDPPTRSAMSASKLPKRRDHKPSGQRKRNARSKRRDRPRKHTNSKISRVWPEIS